MVLINLELPPFKIFLWQIHCFRFLKKIQHIICMKFSLKQSNGNSDEIRDVERNWWFHDRHRHRLLYLYLLSVVLDPASWFVLRSESRLELLLLLDLGTMLVWNMVLGFGWGGGIGGRRRSRWRWSSTTATMSSFSHDVIIDIGGGMTHSNTSGPQKTGGGGGGGGSSSWMASAWTDILFLVILLQLFDRRFSYCQQVSPTTTLPASYGAIFTAGSGML